MIITIKDKNVIIDKKDFLRVNKWKWQINNSGYACRTHWNSQNRKYEKMYMHRYILDSTEKLDIDHKNRNKLDNRRQNLRFVTRSINNFNTKINIKNTSGTKGVSWFKPAKLWRSYITINKKRIELGYSKNKNLAIKRRKEAEIKYGI